MIIKKREAKIKKKAVNMGEWLLNSRGIPDSIRETFFEPDEKDLIDPFKLHNMDKVVARVNQAIMRGETICVDGDV